MENMNCGKVPFRARVEGGRRREMGGGRREMGIEGGFPLGPGWR